MRARWLDRILTQVIESHWLRGRRIFGVIAVLVMFAASAWAMSRAQEAHVAQKRVDRGWVELTSARIAGIRSTIELSEDVKRSDDVNAALARYEERNARILDTLRATRSTSPALALATQSFQRILDSHPDGTVAPTRTQLAVERNLVRLDAVSIDVPPEDGPDVGGRAIRDLIGIHQAARAVELVNKGDIGTTMFGQSILAELLGDGAPRAGVGVGQGTVAASFTPLGEISRVDGHATLAAEVRRLAGSDDARVLADATAWAASKIGVSSSTIEFAAADPAVVNAAGSRLSNGLNSAMKRFLDVEGRRLSEAEAAAQARANVSTTVAVVFGIVAFGLCVLLSRRLQRDDTLLREAASTDKLTGLGNRAHLDERVAAMSQDSAEVVIMHIDLDHFKPVNDTYGHAVGDRVLQLTADRLRESARRHGGAAARLGGDEFALVLPGDATTTADDAATELVESLRDFSIGGLEVTVGASIGVARGSGGLDDLLINADLALYQAKRTGRGQAQTFRAEAAAFVGFVREALTEGRVHCVYQPQISLDDGSCIGAEVLARLTDKHGTLIPAKEWMGIAEWMGITGELFEHVVGAVLRDLSSNPPLHVPLWFNMAPNDLIRPRAGEWLMHHLGRLGLPPNKLGIELTETEAINDSERLAGVLRGVRAAGVGIALDDFGARNTPIGHLVDLPVSRVKLDKSLTDGIGADMPPASWVVASMADLATQLRIEVIAEGVNAGEQISMLRDLGVHQGQGYLCGLPGPMSRIPSRVDLRELQRSSMRAAEVGEPVSGLGPTQYRGPDRRGLGSGPARAIEIR
ncbi:MAG: EAL domain-containing protein [Microthrixaceae bacterium]